ncbi:hypothetical protein RHMOL_Rhmol05G0140700 [Rhododendron molle]|uniref:Uncharacterized protein n=1 Tax=Rhododendron molle TaxID=49168 RepID=A0ACC0NR86_RHOML|nr:hypothetical protein RHMOL_Rhmol05G0140700 [Rhododendron molle]
MNAKESFVDFIKRWRGKAALMIDRPSEKDQIRIISYNLQPDFAKNLMMNTVRTLRHTLNPVLLLKKPSKQVSCRELSLPPLP